MIDKLRKLHILVLDEDGECVGGQEIFVLGENKLTVLASINRQDFPQYDAAFFAAEIELDNADSAAKAESDAINSADASYNRQ